MILCQNLSEEDLRRIGGQVARAFLGEPGCFSVLDPAVAEKLFTLIVTTCYDCGHLYTTGEKQEGFCVWWTKQDRPGAWVQLKMGLKMAALLPPKAGIRMMNSQNHWTPTEKRYRKNKDFVEVFLLAVRREYQGQGHFRAMLEAVFAQAEKRGALCVLDTDARQKAEKYTHVGMRVVDSRVQKSGVTMYALER